MAAASARCSTASRSRPASARRVPTRTGRSRPPGRCRRGARNSRAPPGTGGRRSAPERAPRGALATAAPRRRRARAGSPRQRDPRPEQLHPAAVPVVDVTGRRTWLSGPGSTGSSGASCARCPRRYPRGRRPALPLYDPGMSADGPPVPDGLVLQPFPALRFAALDGPRGLDQPALRRHRPRRAPRLEAGRRTMQSTSFSHVLRGPRRASRTPRPPACCGSGRSQVRCSATRNRPSTSTSSRRTGTCSAAWSAGSGSPGRRPASSCRTRTHGRARGGPVGAAPRDPDRPGADLPRLRGRRRD